LKTVTEHTVSCLGVSTVVYVKPSKCRQKKIVHAAVRVNIALLKGTAVRQSRRIELGPGLRRSRNANRSV